MRSAEQLRRTPREWKDHEQVERERLCAEVIEIFREARESRAEWYVWLENGCPRLTPDQYASLHAPSSRAARGGRAGASGVAAPAARPAPNGAAPGDEHAGQLTLG